MGTIQIDGSTPKLTIGNATAEDATILFDGNAQDFYIALDDSADDLLIGKGSTVGTTPAIAIDENLKVNIPVTTASTSASTGSLTTGGGAGIGADLYVGDDVYLITDSAVLGFGADKDTLLTHTDGTGLTLNSTNKLCFNDASQFIQGSSATVLSIGATDEIDLTATAVDLNGTLDVSGNSQFSGTITVGVDNTGLDVKLFGATSGSYMLWDESADDLNLVASGLGVGTVGVKDLGSGIHVGIADSGATVAAEGSMLVLEDGTDAADRGMTILGATNGTSQIIFGNSGDNDIGKIVYNHDNNSMQFRVSATEHFRIATDGTLTATDTSIGSNSDSRVKENISNFTYDIAKFKLLQPRTFDWKNPSQHNGVGGNRGFIAQEVQAIDDYWVGEFELKDDHADYDLIPADESGAHKSLTSKLGKKDSMYISVINQLIARIEALEA